MSNKIISCQRWSFLWQTVHKSLFSLKPERAFQNTSLNTTLGNAGFAVPHTLRPVSHPWVLALSSLMLFLHSLPSWLLLIHTSVLATRFPENLPSISLIWSNPIMGFWSTKQKTVPSFPSIYLSGLLVWFSMCFFPSKLLAPWRHRPYLFLLIFLLIFPRIMPSSQLGVW